MLLCGKIPADQKEQYAACAKEDKAIGDEEAVLIADKKRFATELHRAVTAAVAKESELLQTLNQGFEWGGPVRTDPPVMSRTREAVFVGGTGWVYGFVRRDNPQLQQAAVADLEKAKKLAGISEFMDPKDYDMLIGIAKSHSFTFDLLNRVVGWPMTFGDQVSRGGFSAQAQPLYASLRGTQTPRLDCPSNGAMVCLAALRLGDVSGPKDSTGKTRLDVKLYGPQLSPAALATWKSLLADGKISSLEITINEGDPIAPASFAVGDTPWLSAPVRLGRVLAPIGIGKLDISQLDFFSKQATENLRSEIQRRAPGVRVNVISNAACRQKLAAAASMLDPNGAFACHDIKIYQQATRQ